MKCTALFIIINFQSYSVIIDLSICFMLTGGNVHHHLKDEACYGNQTFFYHLKCHKWITSSTFNELSPSNSSTNPRQGRFSHSAVLRNKTTMLVIGGFSGVPLGDIYGYKLPVAVVEKAPSAGHCGGYSAEKTCKADPKCGWCEPTSQCFSSDQLDVCDTCLTTATCLGSCEIHVQCSVCLLFGSARCGWCVQDSRCYPILAPTGACRNVTKNNNEELRGWWGISGQFLTTQSQCQTENFPPGMTVVERFISSDRERPDGTMIISRSEIQTKEERRDKIIELLGFIYPFKYTATHGSNYTLILQCDLGQYCYAKLWLSTDESVANLVSSLALHGIIVFLYQFSFTFFMAEPDSPSLLCISLSELERSINSNMPFGQAPFLPYLL